MARRLIERGVRMVQLWNGAVVNQNVDTWDAHNSIVDNHGRHAAEVDQPIAGLITDLKRRGLLDETLVYWHSEFGRMPLSQKGVGRDHNPGAMTVWMAGAGIKGGQTIGASDEFGWKAEQQVISAHDLHATILYLLGIDHKRLTYFFNGRNMRLTDVAGVLIPQIVGLAVTSTRVDRGLDCTYGYVLHAASFGCRGMKHANQYFVIWPRVRGSFNSR